MQKCLVFLLFFMFVLGCGLTQTTTSNIDLEIASFDADSSSFTVTVTNEGSDPAGQFNVSFVMDEIYVVTPESTFVTISQLSKESSVSFSFPNQLSSSDGKGGHAVTGYADSSDTVDETNEGDNSKYAYYYDGSYEAEYDYIHSKQYTWIETARDRVQSYFSWPATGTYYMHLVDELADNLGVRTTRLIKGVYTSVILFDLGDCHDGYSSYEYDDEWVTENSSEEIVYHEYVHAFHREYVVEYGSWNDVPAWLKEGLAVYTAGQGVGRVKYHAWLFKMNDYSVSSAREAMLEAVFGSDEHDNSDYAGDYLAIKYIVSTFGLSVLRNIIYDNANGSDIETAVVNNLSGIDSWSEFQSELRSYADTTITAYWSHLTTSSMSAQGIKRVRDQAD